MRVFALAILDSCAACQRRTKLARLPGNCAGRRIPCGTITGRSRAEFQAKLGIVFEEADECVDWLEYLRDGRISHDPALLKEARELASIFAKSVKTARANTKRLSDFLNS